MGLVCVIIIFDMDADRRDWSDFLETFRLWKEWNLPSKGNLNKDIISERILQLYRS